MSLPSPSHRISDVIRQLIATAAQEESVTIGQILQAFGVRGFAFLILMLSLFNIVIFMVPFSSVVFGLPMVILAAQMVLGIRTPVFPRAIRRQTIKREALIQGLERSIFAIEKIEQYIKPRLTFLTHPLLNRVHGALALVMAIMVTLPVPLFNVPPSFGLVFLSLGMLERDGLFILLGYLIGIWCFYLFKSLVHRLALLASS